jgi:hypothetical protein
MEILMMVMNVKYMFIQLLQELSIIQYMSMILNYQLE